MPPSSTAGPVSGVIRPPVTPAELRKRAFARLAERLDPARIRHRPLSLVRAEAIRLLDGLLDADAPATPRADRDRFIEDVLAAAPGVGPLEELFRDEAVKEALVLAPNQVIARKADSWLPTSVRFRDADQVRAVLARYAEVGEPLAAPAPAGGLAVRLWNGFQVLAVTPPEVMGQPPAVLLVRGPAPAAPSAVAGGSARISWSAATARPQPAPAPKGGSGVVSFDATAPTRSGGSAGMAPPSAVTAQAPVPPPAPPPSAFDPHAKLKQRLTERIIMRFAAAGVYDLSALPANELGRIVSANVADFCSHERLDLDGPLQERLTLEILAGMNRSGQ
jgi:hypothetical protein